MFCPLKFNANTLDTKDGYTMKVGDCKCEEENCAWWVPAEGCCAVHITAWKLTNIERKIA